MKYLPWLIVLVLVAGSGWLYSSNRKIEAELAALRDDNQKLQQAQTDAEEAKKGQSQAESSELARLRKDQEELLRLRNEVRQLRDERQQLGKQVQAAQAQAQDAQARATVAQAVPAAAPMSPQAAAAAEAFQKRYGIAPANPEQANAIACINNLRLIEAAKQQWATENGKPNGTLVTMAQLAPYLKTNAAPACPAGGAYTLNPIGLAPTCTITGHAMTR